MFYKRGGELVVSMGTELLQTFSEVLVLFDIIEGVFALVLLGALLPSVEAALASKEDPTEVVEDLVSVTEEEEASAAKLFDELLAAFPSASLSLSSSLSISWRAIFTA